jgi:phage baseplate assembly protein gpV
MYNLFKDLVSATHNVAKLGDIGDRVIGVQIGRVTDVDDPEYLRRIKVELEAYPGQSTDWLECFAAVIGTDPPLPKLGQLTMVQFINGDPHRGIWQGVKVDPDLNPSFNQGDPRYDSTHNIEGDTVILCGGNYQINCLETLQFNINNDSSFTLAPDGTCTLANKDASLEINKDGKVTVTTLSATLTLNSGDVTIASTSLNLNTGKLRVNGTQVVVTPGHISVGGVQAAMVGGKDSRNDTTLS